MNESEVIKNIAASSIPYADDNFAFNQKLWDDPHTLRQMIRSLKKSVKEHISDQHRISNSFSQKLGKLGNKKFVKHITDKLQIQENNRNNFIPKSKENNKNYGAIMIDEDSVMETDTGGHSPQFKNINNTCKSDSDIEYVCTNQHTPKST